MFINPYVFGNSGTGPYLDGLAVLPRCAHGLRKLISTATACIDVRNTTTSVTTTIGFSGDSIDLSSLSGTYAGAENVVVSRIYDQTGNGYHFDQATQSRMPIIVSSGTYLGDIRFTGSHFMGSAIALPFGTPRWASFWLSNFTTAATRVFLEMSTNSSGANSQAAMLFSAASNRMYMYSQNGTGAARQNWADALAGFAQRSYLFDRSIVGNTEEQSRQLGSNQTMTNTGGSTEQTGNFNSYTVYLGGRGDATLGSAMGLQNLAQYDDDTSSVLASIEAIVGVSP